MHPIYKGTNHSRSWGSFSLTGFVCLTHYTSMGVISLSWIKSRFLLCWHDTRFYCVIISMCFSRLLYMWTEEWMSLFSRVEIEKPFGDLFVFVGTTVVEFVHRVLLTTPNTHWIPTTHGTVRTTHDPVGHCE